ncbi:MAG: DNA replication/repair protein RecF [bacterium]
MRLKRLSLSDFRNWSTLEWEPGPGLNVITGANGQGKSNLLEAIFVLATGKSFRTNYDAELARLGTFGFALGARVEKTTGELSIVLRWRVGRGKTLSLDREEQPRLANLFGKVTAVAFSPEDLAMVKGGPEMRRRALNLLLLQTSPTYYHYLREYNRVLSQRNTYLKHLPPTASSELALEAWDSELTRQGAEVIQRRRTALAELAPWVEERYRELSSGGKLAVAYVPNVPLSAETDSKEVEASFMQLLVKNRREELHRGITLSGPQRDDIQFLLEGRDLKSYGSQGEQRTAALAWKLAEVEYIYARTGDYPLLLLDDVYSELDPERRSYLTMRATLNTQTFITSAEGAQVVKSSSARIWNVRQGELLPG